jgi:hypothetical protein
MVSNLFDPIDFLTLADKLSNGAGESYFRTSISRSYYSVFISTRDKIELQFGKPKLNKPGEIHQAVIDKLKELNLGYLADKLDQLRRWRTKSDYFPNEPIDQNLAKKALKLAKSTNMDIGNELS